MRRALLLGGTGAIGRATARRLVEAGWSVQATGRDPRRLPASLAAEGVRFVPHAESPSALGSGVDLLLDCACFTAADARALLPLAAAAASTVMVSSKAVYVDDAGNHSNSDEPPRFARPVAETQPTLAPGHGDHRTREGYGANKVAAEQVLLDSGLPVSVLRPSKVHGAGARQPREWVFVKRALDLRPVVLLADEGTGGDHTRAAANVAALVELVALEPGTRILNAADPDAPTALQISRTVARLLGHERAEILLPAGRDDGLGRTPWDRVPPVVLDLTAAYALGWQPAGSYAETVAETTAWLVAAAAGGEDADLLPPADDPYFGPLLDYAAEDAFLAGRGRGPLTQR